MKKTYTVRGCKPEDKPHQETIVASGLASAQKAEEIVLAAVKNGWHNLFVIEIEE